MHVRRNQLTIAAVAFVLGLLVVVQLRAQAGGPGLAAAVVAGPDGARREPQRAQRPAAARDRHARARARRRSTQNSARGDVSSTRSRADLAPGPGLRGPRSGRPGPASRSRSAAPSTAAGVEDLVNELRNAGAEAIAVDDVRLVPGVVVAGAPGSRRRSTARRSATRSSSRRSARPRQLTGSLTRSGGDHRPARPRPSRDVVVDGHPGRPAGRCRRPIATSSRRTANRGSDTLTRR